jgi:hypothetical protein
VRRNLVRSLVPDPARTLLLGLVMPAHHDDELPSLDASDLAQVTGGTGDAMSSMMLPMMMMMMRGGSQAPAPAAPPPAPAWTPKILVNGVEQKPSANGTYTAEV